MRVTPNSGSLVTRVGDATSAVRAGGGTTGWAVTSAGGGGGGAGEGGTPTGGADGLALVATGVDGAVRGTDVAVGAGS